jgi:hypothetical protein
MFRRYNRWWATFDQPDPYAGNYDLTNPQSLNRYAYVRNDPVNFVDPSGLDGETFQIDCIGTNCSMVGVLTVNQAPDNGLFGGGGGNGRHLPLRDAENEEGELRDFNGRIQEILNRPPSTPAQPPRQQPQQQNQSRKNCIKAAAKKYLGAQFTSLGKMIALKEAVGFMVGIAVVTRGASEAVGWVEELMTEDSSHRIAAGALPFGMLLAREAWQPKLNFDAYSQAVQDCFKN